MANRKPIVEADGETPALQPADQLDVPLERIVDVPAYSGNAGKVLTVNGGGTAPIWQTPDDGPRAISEDFRTRTTNLTGIGTTPALVTFDQADKVIDSGIATYSAGVWTIQKTVGLFVYTEFCPSWNSGTEPNVWIDIEKNGTTVIGTQRSHVYSSLLQKNSMACVGYDDFVSTDTLRIYYYTTTGSVTGLANTIKVNIRPMETL